MCVVGGRRLPTHTLGMQCAALHPYMHRWLDLTAIPDSSSFLVAAAHRPLAPQLLPLVHLLPAAPARHVAPVVELHHTAMHNGKLQCSQWGLCCGRRHVCAAESAVGPGRQ